MYKIISCILVISTVLLLSSCSEYQEAYDNSFRFSFKKSFIASCAKSGGTKDICACIADDLLETYTPEELNDEEKMKQHVSDVSIKKCRQ